MNVEPSEYHYVPSTSKLLESEDVFMNDYGDSEDKSPKAVETGVLGRSLSAKASSNKSKMTATASLSLPKSLFESVQNKIASAVQPHKDSHFHHSHKDYIRERENDTSFVENGSSRILDTDNDTNNNHLIAKDEASIAIDAHAGVVNFGNRSSSSSSSSSASAAPLNNGKETRTTTSKSFHGTPGTNKKKRSETSESSQSLSSSPLSASPSAYTQSSYSSISLPPPAKNGALQLTPAASVYNTNSQNSDLPLKRSESVRMRHNSFVQPVTKAPVTHKKEHPLNDSDVDEADPATAAIKLSSSPHCNDVLLLAAAAASANGNGSVNTCKLKEKKTEDDYEEEEEEEDEDDDNEQKSILHSNSKTINVHHANSRSASFRRHKLQNLLDRSATGSRTSLTSHNTNNMVNLNSANTKINIDDEIEVIGGATRSGSSKGSRIFKILNKRTQRNSKQRYNSLIIILLCLVNLLNYIDRYTLAGKYPSPISCPFPFSSSQTHLSLE